MKLGAIWRYPLKSLTGQSLNQTVLNPGMGIPHDRRWALARADGIATNGGEWHPKSHFLVLVREFGMAKLRCEFDEKSGKISLAGPDSLAINGNISNPQSRSAIAIGIAQYLGLKENQIPTLVEAASFGYFDSSQGPVSFVNMASLHALEDAMDTPLSPLRFRMNFTIEGGEPWQERSWLGKRVSIGKTILRFSKPTGRCKATHINPETGEPDTKILPALKRTFGHTEMGVYANVIQGGPIKLGDPISILADD